MPPYQPVTIMGPIGYYHSRFYGLPTFPPDRYINSMEPAPPILPLWNLYPVPASPESPAPRNHTSVICHTDKTKLSPSIIQKAPSFPTSPGPSRGPEVNGPGHRRRRALKRKHSDAGSSWSNSHTDESGGRSTSHAVYAKFNRERRKKYIGDMELYRISMRKAIAESRVRMDRMQGEKRVLDAEIGQLREKLAGNDQLMAVLKNLTR
ncbi:uncharacterized protein LOC129590667 [Paramacrobiotus metropolitanus]|uniref:uncharacterized protein LOC129590667 n=1 Tax=Paramacrobiotus metropolitanus TaxID=2943436 RepID=UPI0024461E5E|nr:uncharacterized protein LOC129590667 [Paramacrobiotus metropolitanus]